MRIVSSNTAENCIQATEPDETIVLSADNNAGYVQRRFIQRIQIEWIFPIKHLELPGALVSVNLRATVKGANTMRARVKAEAEGLV